MKPSIRIAVIAFVVVLATLAVRADDPAPRPPAMGPVSALAYGARGDGTTDDAPAIQRAIDANPSRTIFLPDTQPQGSIDYFCGSTLTVKGKGQVLAGECAGWRTGTDVKFPAGVTGVAVSGEGALLKDLSLHGSEQWMGSNPAEAVLPKGFGGGADASDADGVRLAGVFARAENVNATCFGRNGFNVGDGMAGGWADNFSIVNCGASYNRGCGLYIAGGDANAGTTIQFRAYVNQLWGIVENSFLGNTHVSPQTHGNHWDGTPGKAATAVWDRAGVKGGSYYSNPAIANIGSVWIMPYAEGDQPPAQFCLRDIVIGGNLGQSIDPNGAGGFGPPFWIRSQSPGENRPALNFVNFLEERDRPGLLQFYAGKTSGQDIISRYVDPVAKSVTWDEVRRGKSWELWQGRSDGGGKRRVLIPADGQILFDGQPIPIPPPPVKRICKPATIPRGQRTVTIVHELGAAPHLEDVGTKSGGIPVWLTNATVTTLTFTSGSAAPNGGIVFTYSASIRP